MSRFVLLIFDLLHNKAFQKIYSFKHNKFVFFILFLFHFDYIHMQFPP